MLTEKPYPFTSAHPKFRVRGWRELLGQQERVPSTEMVRHTLITGETGSGKSVSGVIPLLESALRYPELAEYKEYKDTVGRDAEPRQHLRPAALVVDPKQELHDVVIREARNRRVTTLRYGTPGKVLYFFEGKDLAKLSAIEAVDSIISQSDFYTRDMATTREPCWNIQAANLLKDFVAVDMYLAKRGMEKLHSLWSKVREQLSKDEEFAPICPTLQYNRDNYFKPISSLVAYSTGDDGSPPIYFYLRACNEMGVPGELTARLVTVMSLHNTTRSSVVWMANGILSDIASEEFAACVSVNPIESPENDFSVREMLNRGDVLVYIPTVSPSAIADMVGRCIKAKFMEFVFTRANKVRPFAYIVDEAHRFITAGESDGEQSLLDRCRAYRTMVVLSTQSIASMQVRLDGGIGFGGAALQVMLNNCGNALYFRSSDIATQQSVEARIPQCPVIGRPHVVKVRPLTSLGTGSCYALRANGTWGLFQVHLSS
ncbi:MAG TPA: type IV secretory system conjugative DNA transfer family protein [Alloacidobacterium sp.]|nr:type IV secretory system conjugative DNA transfer family protein [Alloacidobacterium sp.]